MAWNIEDLLEKASPDKEMNHAKASIAIGIRPAYPSRLSDSAGRPDLFRDEHGLTTVGMAISIMLCLTLLFSGAQIYKVESASAEIQEVADICAMAAENEVAEFMIAVKTCDATILTLTLLSTTCYGLGIVCAAIPPLATLSSELISLANSVYRARDNFSDASKRGLEALQDVLPFLSAAASASVASANNEGAMSANYNALAILLPQSGKPIVNDPGDDLAELGESVNNDAQSIRDKAQEAEEKAEAANEAKARGYAADCGNNPGNCMYERASRLANLSGSGNPFYSSVDTWSFSAAFNRAKNYYSARLNEGEPSGSISDKASYHLRKRFYEYVCDLLAAGYVHEDTDAYDANIPKIFRNTNEMKETPLYAEARYPVSNNETMHAWSGCPACTSITSHSSIKELDNGVYKGCETCGFVVSSMGNIASASTNVPNGFEYHYERFRQASDDYKKAMDELTPLKSEVQDKITPILDKISNAISSAASFRIQAEPPGSNGAIVMMVNLSDNAVDSVFENLFITSGTTLGTRAAVGAAALLEDQAHDNSNVINSLLDGLDGSGGAATGAARMLLDCWSSLLQVYTNGISSLTDTIESALNSIPLFTKSGLGTWAAEALTSIISTLGFEPANLNALKPAILNTGHIASSDSSSFAVNFHQTKSRALSASSPSPDLFTGIVSNMEDDIHASISDMDITIATIEFPIGNSAIPITIKIPPAISDIANGVVDDICNTIVGVIGSVSGIRMWQ